jgi:hypothetical protein
MLKVSRLEVLHGQDVSSPRLAHFWDTIRKVCKDGFADQVA